MITCPSRKCFHRDDFLIVVFSVSNSKSKPIIEDYLPNIFCVRLGLNELGEICEFRAYNQLLDIVTNLALRFLQCVEVREKEIAHTFSRVDFNNSDFFPVGFKGIIQNPIIWIVCSHRGYPDFIKLTRK